MDVNEELKVKMLEYLSHMESGLKSAADFSVEQAPLVVQEFIAWEFWKHTIVASAGILFSCCLLALFWRLQKAMKGEDRLMVIGVGVCAVVISLCISCAEASMAVKAAVAPRVVVLEKVASLVK